MSTTNVIAALVGALLTFHPEPITELDGHVVADDLLHRMVLFEDGDATPLLVNFQPAPGRYAEALPTGAVLPCYVLRPGDAR